MTEGTLTVAAAALFGSAETGESGEAGAWWGPADAAVAAASGISRSSAHAWARRWAGERRAGAALVQLERAALGVAVRSA